MADNTVLASGSGGDTIATDDIAGVKYPRSKIVIGADGVNDGDVSSANPLPVTGSLTVDLGANNDVTVTNATASSLKAEVVGTGTFAVQVSSIAAGDNNIGNVDIVSLPALAAGTNNIGDVDVLTVPADPFGVNADAASASGSISAKLRFIASTGIPITGTVTVGAHAVTNAGTFAVQAAQSGTWNIGTVTTVSTVTAVTTVGTVTTLTGSAIAHDAVDSGNPHKIGAKATTSLSGLTLVAAADRTDLMAGVDGVLINRPHTNLEEVVTGNATNTDGTSTQCIAAQAAGIKTYLTSIILCNTSASNITVDIKDGSTTKVSIPVPAGGGAIFNPPVPLPGTAATAWNFDPSAAATTVTCSMIGFKSKV